MPFSYALQTLRARKGSFAGAFVALFFAALLITSCGMLLETGIHGGIAVERYAGTPIVVAGDQNVHQDTVETKGSGARVRTKVKHKAKPLSGRVWLSAALVERIAGVPGVRSAIPELTFPARIVSANGPGGGAANDPGYGHAWSSAALTPFTLSAGRAPAAPGEVVLDAGLAARDGLHVGDRVTVRSTLSPADYTVSGIATAATPLSRQSTLFFADGEARRLAAHPGLVTVIGVLPQPGTDPAALAGRIADATGATVHLGADRGPVEFLDAADARVRLISMGAVIGGTSLLVAALVVSGTFALGIQQRAREIALLRAVAATPRQLRRMIGREALAVGLLAGVLGAIAGLPAGALLYGRFVALGTAPASLHLSVSVFPMLAAVLGTTLGGWAAARTTARRAGRVRPVEALAESGLPPQRIPVLRTLVGLLVLVGGVVLVAVLAQLGTEKASTPVTFVTVLVLTIALSLLGPVVARAATGVVAPLLRGSRVSGYLAGANLRADPRRFAAVTVPLALLTAMVCTVLFTQTTLASAAADQAAAGSRGNWTLVADAPGLPPGAAAAVRALPGVRAVTEVLHSIVRIGVDAYQAQGVSTQGLSTGWDPGIAAGTLGGFADGDVAVSARAAASLGVGPGDGLAITLGDGTPVTLAVTAVYRSSLGFGDLTVSAALLSAHLDDPLAPAAGVVAGPEVTQAQLASVTARFPGVRVLDRSGAARLATVARQNNASVNLLAMGLVLAFTAISVVNTLAMSTGARGGEFSLLRLSGATRTQLRRMLRWEALGVAGTGVLIGTGIAAAVLSAFSAGMTGSAGPGWGWGPYVGVVALAATLTLAATALPARTLLRRRAS